VHARCRAAGHGGILADATLCHDCRRRAAAGRSASRALGILWPGVCVACWGRSSSARIRSALREFPCARDGGCRPLPRADDRGRGATTRHRRRRSLPPCSAERAVHRMERRGSRNGNRFGCARCFARSPYVLGLTEARERRSLRPGSHAESSTYAVRPIRIAARSAGAKRRDRGPDQVQRGGAPAHRRSPRIRTNRITRSGSGRTTPAGRVAGRRDRRVWHNAVAESRARNECPRSADCEKMACAARADGHGPYWRGEALPVKYGRPALLPPTRAMRKSFAGPAGLHDGPAPAVTRPRHGPASRIATHRQKPPARFGWMSWMGTRALRSPRRRVAADVDAKLGLVAIRFLRARDGREEGSRTLRWGRRRGHTAAGSCGQRLPGRGAVAAGVDGDRARHQRAEHRSRLRSSSATGQERRGRRRARAPLRFRRLASGSASKERGAGRD